MLDRVRGFAQLDKSLASHMNTLYWASLPPN